LVIVAVADIFTLLHAVFDVASVQLEVIFKVLPVATLLPPASVNIPPPYLIGLVVVNVTLLYVRLLARLPLLQVINPPVITMFVVPELLLPLP
jgi:hypothetical protein